MMMFTWPYLIEILTPARSPEDKVARLQDRFADRCRRLIDCGCGVSIPDNPMGRPRYSAFECFEATNYWPDPEKVVLNLNTFHSKDELDAILRISRGMKIYKEETDNQALNMDPQTARAS